MAIGRISPKSCDAQDMINGLRSIDSCAMPSNDIKITICFGQFFVVAVVVVRVGNDHVI